MNLVIKYCTLFFKVSRLDNIKPALLLYTPCLWGIFDGYNKNISKYAMIQAVFIFFIGSIAARSFGCIVNDIIDKDIDILVERTKNRPIASGALKVWQAILMSFVWLVIGLFCFFVFNLIAKLTIIFGLLLSILYPFSKRFIKIPQYVLGFAFNTGVLVGYAAIYRGFSNEIMVLYGMGVYWTLFYDTIYAIQDIKNDKEIGIFSSAIYYEKNLMKQLMKFAIMIVGCNVLAGIFISAPWFFYIFSIILFFILFKILIKLSQGFSLSILFELNIYIGFIIAGQLLLSRIYG